MAEGGGGWWGSLSEAVKNKSAEVLEFMKRDLDELSSTVKNEASHVVHSTTNVLKEQLSLDQPESTVNSVKRSMSSFLDTVSNVLNPAPDDSDQEAMIMKGNVPVVLTRFQAQLHNLMTLEETFTLEPEGAEAVQYAAWLDIQDPLNSDNLTKLMVAHTELHAQYFKLVPSKVSHADFWQRFLFRRALLEDEEARREAQERRQHREAQEADQFLSHQEEDFSSDKLDISVEDQIRLLQEYEIECKTKTAEENTNLPDSSSSSPRKLHLSENHYSDGKASEKETLGSASDVDSETSLITDAKNRLFSLVKTAMDSLDLLDIETETEESSTSEKNQKCKVTVGDNDCEDFNQNAKITVKEKADMVILGNVGDKDDTDTGPEDTPDTAVSSSSSSAATLPDDEWERLQAVDEAEVVH